MSENVNVVYFAISNYKSHGTVLRAMRKELAHLQKKTVFPIFSSLQHLVHQQLK